MNKCSYCGAELEGEVDYGFQPASIIASGTILIESSSHRYLSCRIAKNGVIKQGNFCSWNCMISWLNEVVAPELVMDELARAGSQ